MSTIASPTPSDQEPTIYHQGVLLIGVGGLGCAVAMALAASGVTRMTLVDGDSVERSNLHRQLLFQESDLGKGKTTAAKAKLLAQYPALQITERPQRLETVEQIGAAAQGHALVVDGSDSFATRFAANDAALKGGFPLVHGAVTGFRGQIMTILPGQSACLRCLFGGPPETTVASCREAGVLGPSVGEIGWLMALEAVKLLRRVGTPLSNRLLTIDFLAGKRRVIPLRRQPNCPACAGL